MSRASEYANSVSSLYAQIGEARAREASNKGQIWSGALANIGDFVAQYPERQAKMEEIKNRAAITDLEKQKFQMEADTLKRKQADDQLMRDTFAAHAGDIDGAIDELVLKNPAVGLPLKEKATQSKKIALDYRESQLKAKQQEMEFLAGLVGPVTDDETYMHGLYTAKEAGLDVSKLPPSYEAAKPYIEQLRHGTENGRKQLDAQLKALTEQRQLLVAQNEAANKVADNARQAEALKNTEAYQATTTAETARHNKAMEARQAATAGSQAADITKLTPGGLDLAALSYKKTGVMPPLGMGDRTTRQQIINRAAALTPADITRIETSGQDIAGNKADYKADSTSLVALTKQRDAITAFENTAKKNIDLFLDAAKNVADTGIPLLNAPVRWVAGAGGSANLAKYNAARQVAISEIARIVQNPNLTGQLSDTARKEIEVFNPANATLKQTMAVMDLLKQDMANRKNSLDEQLKDTRSRIGATGATPEQTTTGSPDTGYDVVAPNGKTYHFPTKGAAEGFKARAGIK